MNDSSGGAKHMLWYYILKLYRELQGSGIFSPSPLGGGGGGSEASQSNIVAHTKNY